MPTCMAPNGDAAESQTYQLLRLLVPLITYPWCHPWKVLLLVSMIFSHRPEETILFVIVKARLHFIFFLFLRALKEYFLLTYGIK